MAIYYLDAGFVSRSTGRSAVQSAAYLTGSRLEESRREIVANYRNSGSDIVFATTLAPAHAPEAFRQLAVWDSAENYEDAYAIRRYRTEETRAAYRMSAQTAQTIVVALPKELNPDSWKELATEFAQDRFVSRGLVVTLAIHNDEGNPHAHLQISRRAVTDKGEWAWAKDRAITTRSALLETRRLWAEKTNAYLEREGIEERIDHRSFADLGIPFEPTRHEGWYGHKLRELGYRARIIDDNDAARQENRERLALDPEAILTELTTKQATFTPTALARLIQTRIQDDAKLASYVYEKALQAAVTVGVGLDGQLRYTSQAYAAKEQEALGWVRQLSESKQAPLMEAEQRDEILKTEYAYLSAEQRASVEILCADAPFSVLIGRAGTGKTTTLKAVVDLATRAGFSVIGLALSAAAAENLGQEALCPAETVAFYLDKWQRLEQAKQQFWSIHPSSEHAAIVRQLEALTPYAPSARHVLIVDEAGMLGTAQWHALLQKAQATGARVIAVGDDHQFKAIEAGDFFRKLTDIAETEGSLATLQTIYRQKEPWMREASRDLAELRTWQALSSYEQQGLVHRVEGDLHAKVVAAYVERTGLYPTERGLLLAYTRAECQSLNDAVRVHLKAQGRLPAEDIRLNGRPFAIGDRIIFLQNDRLSQIETFDPASQRKKDFLVKNGTRGEILSIRDITLQPSLHARLWHQKKPEPSYEVTAALSPDTHARFCVKDYDRFDHAYAVTLHKSQGRTVDWSMVVASRYMDAYASYVALTRHREDVTLFYDSQTFGSFKSLQQSLSRLSHKDLVIDYTIPPVHQAAWEAVQEYKWLGQDLMATAREQNWSAWWELKKERETAGKEILDDWEQHAKYAEQAGLSRESIAIACGLKMRPLSLAEQEARQQVEAYWEKAFAARLVWREIRETHPGRRCAEHSRYAEFTALRQERNALAQVLVANKPLYREFVREGQSLGMGWRTLQTQARQPAAFTAAAERTAQRSAENTFEPDFASGRRPQRETGGQLRAAFQPTRRVDAAQVVAELNAQIESLASELLGEPSSKSGREWRYGRKGSIAVQIAGEKQGLYSDFEQGIHGGPLKLIQEQQGLNSKEAFKWALDWLGHTRATGRGAALQPIHPRTGRPEQAGPVRASGGMDWTPLYPVPAHAPEPDLSGMPQLRGCLQRFGQETARFAYRDAEKNLLGYAVRLENEDGRKAVLPLTYCRSEQGQQQWRWKGFGDDRPLYGLDQLAQHPDRPVLLVEGEKTAEAGKTLFPDHAVVSWHGGAGAVGKVDWTPLVGRAVTMWPDNDTAGRQAADKIEQQLLTLHRERDIDPNLRRVQIPEQTPEKWDIADPIPEGWGRGATLQGLVASAEREPISQRQAVIRAKLDAYGLERPKELTGVAFAEQVHGLFEALKQRDGQPVSLGAPQDTGQSKRCMDTFAKQEHLAEKAILATALLPSARRACGFMPPWLETKHRSEAIALTAAGLMQENREKDYTLTALRHLVKEGRCLYDAQQAQWQQQYQTLHPNASETQLKILAEQQTQFRMATGRDLAAEAREMILRHAGEFERLQQAGLVKAASEVVLAQQQGGSRRETIETASAALERQFMEISQRESAKGRETSKETERLKSHQKLEKALEETMRTRQMLEREHQQTLEATQTKTRGHSRGIELGG